MSDKRNDNNKHDDINEFFSLSSIRLRSIRTGASKVAAHLRTLREVRQGQRVSKRLPPRDTKPQKRRCRVRIIRRKPAERASYSRRIAKEAGRQ